MFPMFGKFSKPILCLAVFFSAVVFADAGFWGDLYGDWHEGYTKFHDAAKAGDVEKLAYYLDRGYDINKRSRSAKCTALGVAVCSRQYDAAKFLLEQGADPSIPYLFGSRYRTPLQAAAEYGRMNFIQLLMQYVDSVDEGMDDPYPSCYGSAFTWACAEGHLDIAKYLLEKGANINVKNSSHAGTPLVASVRQLRLESVRFLLANGANTTIPDKLHGRTPLGWCEKILDPKFSSVRSILEWQQHGAISDHQLQAGTNTCREIIALLKAVENQ